MTPLFLALSLLMTDAPPPDGGAADGGAAAVGEPLPQGAPTDSYELAAWCYGALDEYLTIYDRVIPDLKDMDRMFGTSVVEAKPYQADMAAAHEELKMIGASVTDAEKASPRPISDRGAAAIHEGRAVWSVAESKSERELARAWMLWALPDRCDSNAKELTQRSLLLGRALGYNTGSSTTDSSTASGGGATAGGGSSATTTPDAGGGATAGGGSATTTPGGGGTAAGATPDNGAAGGSTTPTPDSGGATTGGTPDTGGGTPAAGGASGNDTPTTTPSGGGSGTDGAQTPTPTPDTGKPPAP